MWQDIVISVVCLLFGFILLPLLRDIWRGGSINIYTAGLTTVGLYVMGYAFFTLELWISFIAEIFSGTIWLLLFILSVKHRKRRKY
ncbi:MAG: hypothetical protein R6V50_00705 [Thermoplasmatota archaeon]